MDFAGGLVQLVAVKAYTDGALVGRELKDLEKTCLRLTPE